MKKSPQVIISWIIVIWSVLVFVPSLPFKFSGAPETQHIFGTIGHWLEGFMGVSVGQAFSDYAAYIIGSLELITSFVLLAPAFVMLVNRFGKKDFKTLNRRFWHTIGGLMASALMGGAMFFHLFSDLGIDVNGDGGALFYSATSVFVGGILLFLINRERSENSQGGFMARCLAALKPRSWKHWLFWVEVVPLFFICLIGGLLSFYVHQAYTDRYPQEPIDSVPTFSEITLPFDHYYRAEDSLPFLASAIIDVNNDGVEEIFLGGGRNQRDVLYAYNDAGEFEDVSAAHSISHSSDIESQGVAVLDLDLNGWDDLIIARENGVYVLYNDAGKFREEALGLVFNEKSSPLSIALGDINKDGWADMFVATYIRNSFVEGQTTFNDHTYGASSQLFLNNGDNTFTDITESAGMSYIHNTFQGNFVDLDNDSDQDLVVSYDTGNVRTWRNNGDNTFTNMSNPTSGTFGYPMGNALGDYNNDGLIDLAFSNVGNMGPLNMVLRGDLRSDQVFDSKIYVLENQGNFKFKNVSESLHIADYEFSWGMLFEDFNADGRQDLVMAQNYVQLPYSQLVRLPGRFLLQARSGLFTNKEKVAGVINRAFEIAPLAADFNNDGALDLVRANLQGQSKVQISDGHGNRFLKLKLPNTAASLGAKVVLRLRSGRTLTKQFVTSEGLSSDGSHVLFFGLGPSDVVKSLTVRYLSGAERSIENPPVNALLSLDK